MQTKCATCLCTQVDSADTQVDSADTQVDSADTQVDSADTQVDSADTQVDTRCFVVREYLINLCLTKWIRQL